jgi:hypothetical protein
MFLHWYLHNQPSGQGITDHKVYDEDSFYLCRRESNILTEAESSQYTNSMPKNLILQNNYHTQSVGQVTWRDRFRICTLLPPDFAVRSTVRASGKRYVRDDLERMRTVVALVAHTV